jgi:hypothetical protein
LTICFRPWPRSTEVTGPPGTALAQRVLAVGEVNADAEDLLAAPADLGEIRLLTVLFADLVDPTVLSTRLEPETYRQGQDQRADRPHQPVPGVPHLSLDRVAANQLGAQQE